MRIRSKEELIQYIESGNTVKYVFFWGHKEIQGNVSKSCFSQWYDAPYETEGIRYLTAEHHMMHQKAILFGDESAAERLVAAKSPGEAKAIGREVRDFDQQVWESRRFEIVTTVNIAKFVNNTKIRNFLLNTGSRVLVEASPVDKIWGIGLGENELESQNPKLWNGLNLLGFALMEARDQLSKQ